MPPPIDDADIADLSMELNNVHLDENMHGVDDIVPEADPEVDGNVRTSSSLPGIPALTLPTGLNSITFPISRPARVR